MHYGMRHKPTYHHFYSQNEQKHISKFVCMKRNLYICNLKTETKYMLL